MRCAAADVTDRHDYEARLRLLDELNHRVKNALAIVQSIATLTLKGVDSEVRHAFVQRLHTLAAMHGLLAESNWSSAELRSNPVGVAYIVAAGRASGSQRPHPAFAIACCARFRTRDPRTRYQRPEIRRAIKCARPRYCAMDDHDRPGSPNLGGNRRSARGSADAQGLRDDVDPAKPGISAASFSRNRLSSHWARLHN